MYNIYTYTIYICIIDKCQLYCIIVLHYDVLRKLSTSLCFHSLFISFLNSFFSVSLCHQFAMFSHVSRHFSIHQFADSLLSYFPTTVVDTCQLPIRERERGKIKHLQMACKPYTALPASSSFPDPNCIPSLSFPNWQLAKFVGSFQKLSKLLAWILCAPLSNPTGGSAHFIDI